MLPVVAGKNVPLGKPPRSCTTVSLIGEDLAVFIGGNSMSAICARPWLVAWKFSLRVSIHLIGRCSLSAMAETT